MRKSAKAAAKLRAFIEGRTAPTPEAPEKHWVSDEDEAQRATERANTKRREQLAPGPKDRAALELMRATAALDKRQKMKAEAAAEKAKTMQDIDDLKRAQAEVKRLREENAQLKRERKDLKAELVKARDRVARLVRWASQWPRIGRVPDTHKPITVSGYRSNLRLTFRAAGGLGPEGPRLMEVLVWRQTPKGEENERVARVPLIEIEGQRACSAFAALTVDPDEEG